MLNRTTPRFVDIFLLLLRIQLAQLVYMKVSRPFLMYIWYLLIRLHGMDCTLAIEVEDVPILAMTLIDVVSPIGLVPNRCPTALFWRSLARTFSSQLHDCYNWEEEADSSSSTTSFWKRWLRRSASAAIPLRIAVVDEQKRFTLTTMCERRMV